MLYNVAQGRERSERTLGLTDEMKAPTLKGLYNRRITHKGMDSCCGTLSGFVSLLSTMSQGGAAAPLTLGYVVLPLWGIRHVDANRL